MIFQTKSVGIDVQPNFVRIAVANGHGGKMRVLNLIEKEVPEVPAQDSIAAAASAIREVFEENGLNGDICVASLPAAVSISRLMTTPITDPGKIRQTLKFQMEPQIPYPIDQVISDFVSVRKTGEGTEILAIAVTKDFISEKLHVFETAKVDPQIITLDAVAMADFYMNPFDFSPDKITALLHVDRKSSFLGFFDGENLVGYRNLDGMPPGDGEATRNMTREIQRSLLGFQSSTATSAEIGTLCIAGQDSDKLQKFLQESFRDFPVKTVEFNENALAEIPGPLLDRVEDWQLSIALAHVGLGMSANSINFRRDEYAPVSPLSRLKRNIVFSLAVLAVVLVAWFGSVAAQMQHQSRQLESLTQDMLKIFAETLPGIKSPESAQQKIEQEQERFKALKNYSSEYVSPLDVLAGVAASIPKNKNLTLNDLAISDNILRMTGEVDSFDDINIFKERLEDCPLISEVKIDSATKAEKGNKVNFRIRARITRESE